MSDDEAAIVMATEEVTVDPAAVVRHLSLSLSLSLFSLLSSLFSLLSFLFFLRFTLEDAGSLTDLFESYLCNGFFSYL